MELEAVRETLHDLEKKTINTRNPHIAGRNFTAARR